MLREVAEARPDGCGNRGEPGAVDRGVWVGVRVGVAAGAVGGVLLDLSADPLLGT